MEKNPSVAFNAVASDEEQLCLAAALSTLTRSISKAKNNDYLNGRLKLIPHELKLRGKAGWDSTMPMLTTHNEETSSWARA